MQARRDAAFTFPEDKLLGIPVRPLSPRLFLILHDIGSVFVTGHFSPHMHGNLAAEIRAFFWIISPEFREAGLPGQRSARRKLIRQVDKLDAIEAVHAIRGYVNAAFADAPGAGAHDTTPYCSMIAQMIDIMAREYGWSALEIINMPLAQFWQMRACIMERTAETPIHFNRELDQWQRDYMHRANARN